ncbi:MAG: MFS transporter [Syntrophomonadaceae bacterium]|jgi:EmrB/QacA subfamily drug resistance transporter
MFKTKIIEKKWQVLILICIGIFISTLDGSIVNIANPVIAKSLSVSMQEVQWVVTSYMLIITATLLLFGKLGDQFGNIKVYTYGFLIFTIGSFICYMSPTLSFLIAARIFQGIGASMMMATGMGIVSNTFPAGERGKALGITGSIVGIGNMSGPSIGGILIGHFSWPAIFLINIPIGLAGFFLGLKFFNMDAMKKKVRPDYWGNLLFALALTFLMLGLSKENTLNYELLILGILILVLFFINEKKQTYPLLDFRLFKVKNFVYGNIMGFASYASQTAVFFMIPFYLDRILHLSPITAGLVMTLTPALMAITAPLAGSLSDRIGAPRLTSIAFILLILGHGTLSTLNGSNELIRIAVGLILLGLGAGSFGSPNNSSIFGSLPKEKAGYVGGFIATIRNFAFAFGLAVSVSIFSHIYNNKILFLSSTAAYINANMWIYRFTAAICLGGLLVSVFSSHHRLLTKNNKVRL